MDHQTDEAVAQPESEVRTSSFIWNGVVHKHEWVVTPAGLLVWEQITRTPLPFVEASERNEGSNERPREK